MIKELSKLDQSDYVKNGLSTLLEIPEPPTSLWCLGNLPTLDLTLLTVVGSRNHTSYAPQVIDHLLSGLAGYKIGIISGLALGIDTLAHEAALRYKLYTLAVPGSGLNYDVLYPATNKRLASKIIEAGGGLISELANDTKAAPWTFPRRNRIMAGLAKATLLIEASEKSGTLITARLAVDYNRELLAVPGSIFSKNTVGNHQFLKLGATLVTDSSDILTALNLEVKPNIIKASDINLTRDEQAVVDLLLEPKDKDTITRQLNLTASEASRLLMNMEIQGYIKYDAPNYRSLV